MKAEAYILTREINEYNQDGKYFVAWFHSKPSIKELRSVTDNYDSVTNNEYAKHILCGGGRKGTENEWWQLRLVSSSN
ncbi:MAG: hypothetical protein WC390_06470 [Sulfurimonas sp.]|jgi:hypothetical protein